MKILYLIVSHTNPEQLVRLATTLKQNSTAAQIVIHHDFAKCGLDRAAFNHLSDVHILEEYVSVQWGEFSMVEMEIHCLNWVMAQGLSFDWLILLSGQDYPIQPLSAIESFLRTTDDDGLMEYFPVDEPPQTLLASALQWDKNRGKERFFFRYHRVTRSRLALSLLYRLGQLFNNRQPWFNIVACPITGGKIGLRVTELPFSRCYAGSQWFTLSYPCIKYIDDFIKKHPDFVEHYRHTIIPDESFFQTILLNHPHFKISPNNRRFISWTSPTGGTVVLRNQDFENLIASEQHFARKFDTRVDSQILDRLDQYCANTRNNCVQDPNICTG